MATFPFLEGDIFHVKMCVLHPVAGRGRKHDASSWKEKCQLEGGREGVKAKPENALLAFSNLTEMVSMDCHQWLLMFWNLMTMMTMMTMTMTMVVVWVSKARPEWALPAFSISVRGPSLPPRQAQVPATIASEHSLVHSVTCTHLLISWRPNMAKRDTSTKNSDIHSVG